jgi:hypothetical protein
MLTLDQIWPIHVERYLSNHVESWPWKEIYKLSCKESNINSQPGMVHPYLRLRPPRDSEIEAAALEPAPTPPPDGRCDESCRELTEQPAAESFPFDDLPLRIQLMIFEKLLVFPGQLVHVLSRLDPFCPPQDRTDLEGSDGRLRLLQRFHIGRKSCSLTYAIKPQELLAPLLVCQKWCYIGTHVFMGRNTFAFSSLGEFGRFSGGIGYRIQRLRYIELL